MSEDIAIETAACDECGLPVGIAAAGAPCPYCGHLPHTVSTTRLRAAFYGMPLADLQRLKLALHSDHSEGDAMSTTVDVLLALYVISEETAPPEQLNEVIENVVGGRLDQLPLPRRGSCFCDSGKRYGKCHGRS